MAHFYTYPSGGIRALVFQTRMRTMNRSRQGMPLRPLCSLPHKQKLKVGNAGFLFLLPLFLPASSFSRNTCKCSGIATQDFILEVESHVRIKRKLFEEYLDRSGTVCSINADIFITNSVQAILGGRSTLHQPTQEDGFYGIKVCNFMRILLCFLVEVAIGFSKRVVFRRQSAKP